jgi:hypothetical protein
MDVDLVEGLPPNPKEVVAKGSKSSQFAVGYLPEAISISFGFCFTPVADDRLHISGKIHTLVVEILERECEAPETGGSASSFDQKDREEQEGR